MRKDWKAYEIVLLVISIGLLLAIIAFFIGVISLTNTVIGMMFLAFYGMIGIIFFRINKFYMFFFIVLGVIAALPYFL